MRLTLIPSPFYLDQHRKSMGRAPETLLAAGLVGLLENDGHSVVVAERDVNLGEGDRLTLMGRNLAILAEMVANAQQAGRLPVILGGDCTLAIGVVAGLRRVLTEDFGIAWFDAHGDFNTPDTTLSSFLGGMPLACCCGRGLETLRAAAGLTQPVNEAYVSLLGVRDLDPPEKALLDTTPVRRYSPEELANFRAEARPTYLHFDIDVLDPAYAPGVNYLTPNGLTPEAALAAARPIRPHLAALSLTAVDPEIDAAKAAEQGQTVQTALALLRAMLGPTGTLGPTNVSAR
jgi:arginase